MKKLFGFMLLIAFCAIMSPVVTANNPPGTNQSFYNVYIEKILPVQTVIPAVSAHQEYDTLCAIMIIQPAEGISVTNKPCLFPEVCNRSGPNRF